MTILSVSNLTKKFGGNIANNKISFDVKENQIVGVIGPNGAGKTTTFNLLSGFIPANEGKIIFDGKDLASLKSYKIAELGVVRTFQHTSVFSELTVFENILTAQHLKASKLMKIALLTPSKYRKREEKFKEKAHEIIELLSLTKEQDLKANTLPYGDQRKLAIGIALAAEPKILLLDEPAAGMNDTESASLVRAIKKLRDEGLTVLIVEHDMKVVMNLCDYIVVIDHGIKIAEGTPEEISRDPKVLDVYLGSESEDAVSEKEEV